MPTRKINVMHLIINLKRDGAQQVVRTLAEYQKMSDACEPIVCTFKDGPLREDIEALGIKVEILPERRYSIVTVPLFLADMVKIWRALRHLIKKYNIDVIQTQLLNILNFLVLPLRYTSRARVVLWTFQNAKFGVTIEDLKHKWTLKPKRFFHNLLYRLTAPFASGFIAVSEEVKHTMIREIGPIGKKITVICNAVDVRRYEQPVDTNAVRQELGFDNDARLLAIVARLQLQKGHCYLVDAMSAIVKKYPNVHALFIGQGELQAELEAQVEQLKLGDNIHFLGSRKDVPALLATSELFVLPSLWEGLSVALLEAMAAAKPIVATAVSGTTQAMIAGKTGVIVEPGNSQALAAGIIQLLDNPELAMQMGQAAKQYVVDNYSAQNQAKEHLALYRKLLKV